MESLPERLRKVEYRFWPKVDRCGPDECWEWLASKGRFGYGQFKFEGSDQRASRVAWMLENGTIPDGLFVCHRCDNPGCCNAAHLFLGTAQDNMNDKTAKGRGNTPKGDDHIFRRDPSRVPRGSVRGHAKLTEDDVRTIRATAAKKECSNCALARRYGVCHEVIDGIVARRRWAHVPEE